MSDMKLPCASTWRCGLCTYCNSYFILGRWKILGLVAMLVFPLLGMFWRANSKGGEGGCRAYGAYSVCRGCIRGDIRYYTPGILTYIRSLHSSWRTRVRRPPCTRHFVLAWMCVSWGGAWGGKPVAEVILAPCIKVAWGSRLSGLERGIPSKRRSHFLHTRTSP